MLPRHATGPREYYRQWPRDNVDLSVCPSVRLSRQIRHTSSLYVVYRENKDAISIAERKHVCDVGSTKNLNPRFRYLDRWISHYVLNFVDLVGSDFKRTDLTNVSTFGFVSWNRGLRTNAAEWKCDSTDAYRTGWLGTLMSRVANVRVRRHVPWKFKEIVRNGAGETEKH